MDLRKLKTLIELVESSGIAELEISEGEERVRITPLPLFHEPASLCCTATNSHRIRASTHRTRQDRKAGRACSKIAHGRQFLSFALPPAPRPSSRLAKM